jgi:hypothetical protein
VSHHQSKSTSINFVIIVIATIVIIFAISPTIVHASAIYYIDCVAGSNTNNGTSTTSAWLTPSRANSAPLAAGDQILLKRNCIWTDSMQISASGTAISPILIGAYGTGNLPRIDSNTTYRFPFRISGTYITVENVQANGIAPRIETGCSNTGVGEIVGFYLSGSYITLRYITATNLSDGVKIETMSHHNKILNSTLTNNNMMISLTTSSGDDYGAFGILVLGNDNEIANNTISGSAACSYDYGTDGSAVEVYGGQRNYIHHNKALNNETFTELARDSSRSVNAVDNRFVYNQVWGGLSKQFFLATRGGSSGRGPVLNTQVYNNTVYLSSNDSIGIGCDAGCDSTILTLKNNIIWAANNRTDMQFNEGYNLYWTTSGNPYNVFGTGKETSTSKIANPLFVNSVGNNFQLQSSSAAINAGTLVGYSPDLNNGTVPSAGVTDMGAYEYQAVVATATFTPTALATIRPTNTPISTTVVSTSTPRPTSTVVPSSTPAPTFAPPTNTAAAPTSTKLPTIAPTNTAVPTINPAPTVAITAPLNGASVLANSRITISAFATDAIGVSRVEFWANGTLICTDTGVPYSCRWRTPNIHGISAQIKAIAYNTNGFSASSMVTVNIP